MGFWFGFLLGGRGPSDSFWRGIFLMLAWGFPLAFGKLVAANAGASFYVPAALAAYAAMIVFAFWRPATSTLKLSLIEGTTMWARLVLIVFAVGAVWNLYDAGFVIWRTVGLWRDLVWCGSAVGLELLIRWWIRRDVTVRGVVFD